MSQGARYSSTTSITLAPGVRIERLTPPSRLFGANGLRTGADNRIYVAQVAGSQISALDVGTGDLETVSAKGGAIVAPDDIAFDPDGNLIATEYMNARVSLRGKDGRTRVIRDDIPGANGITVHQGRLFVNECRIGGRLMELPLDGGAPRILQDNLPMPNAMEVGPDGLLYYPVMGTNDIWRIDPDGGVPERVAGDLGVPDSVKFDAAGFIVSTQVQTGEVLRIDPRTGDRQVLARLAPGLDNCTFVGDRLFVSSFTGEITEIRPDGETREILAGGLMWPLDLTAGPDGDLYLADGTYLYLLRNGELHQMASLFSPGTPGYVRGITAVGADEILCTTSTGEISYYRPGPDARTKVVAQGFDQLYGVAVTADRTIVAAELGAGRVLSLRSGQVSVLASGLDAPMGVAFAPDGTVLVSESGAGRITGINDAGVDTVVDGLETPQGILVHGNRLLILDAGLKALVSVDLDTKARQTLATHLPVGAPPGVVAEPLRGTPPFSGPMGPFAGLTAGPDGTVYLSADAEGSVLALRFTE
ncbi:SMP-30/gluconolactonase/LRE family protein [Nocardia goodfellowii]|uniref:Sugar lactone lactonase YvrE n=1 Tax=Nocardia goodfellowii TaxID=882446 RepID=A0ABS4QJX8_9NOCA|nr:SMP-30/gluconolactonase/LRE family protein [Nocardia goodfellowii]MBP2192014.1 sugar lactone lactonase YvrE [Nocardia goodfellowii]